ncbi:MAG: hypothetical protein ACK4OK_10185, partial [Thermoflexus sp.]
MRAYLPWYLVVGYTGAAWAAATGVILLRWGQICASCWLRAGGTLLLLGSGIGFFTGVPEIWTPGPAGTELSLMSGLAILGAWGTFRASRILYRFIPNRMRTSPPEAHRLLSLPSRLHPEEISDGGSPPQARKFTKWVVALWGILIAVIFAIWRWDLSLFFALNRYAGRTPWIDGLAYLLINDYAVPTALAMLAWAMWLSGDPRRQAAVLRATLVIPISGFILEAMNAVYFRPRPFTDHEVNLLFYHPSDSSFPSNAATVAWAIAVALWTGDQRIG